MNQTIRWVTLVAVMFSGSTVMCMAGENKAFSDNKSVTLFEEHTQRLDQQLDALLDHTARHPDSWVHLERVAEVYFERARLTGNFEDYIASQQVLDKAFALAGDGGGPALTRARLNFSMHRLLAVEADLEQAASALLIDEPTRLAIDGIRADVYLYTAQYAKAKRAYKQHELNSPSVISATRLAHHATQLGNHEEAELWLVKAEQRVVGQSPHLRSWLQLQRGLLDLDRGELDKALVHYQQGLAIFPGYWLLEEHIAEIDVLQGRERIAEQRYRDLVERTGSPEFMAALAAILAQRDNESDRQESEAWLQKIHDEYDARISVLPELVGGHALDFFLQAGDPQRALQLARDNYRIRPGGQAGLQLVQAQLAHGDVDQASMMMETLLKSPYRSAELHATAAVVLRAIDRHEQADAQDRLAVAMNPSSVADVVWLRH